MDLNPFPQPRVKLIPRPIHFEPCFQDYIQVNMDIQNLADIWLYVLLMYIDLTHYVISKLVDIETQIGLEIWYM